MFCRTIRRYNKLLPQHNSHRNGDVDLHDIHTYDNLIIMMNNNMARTTMVVARYHYQTQSVNTIGDEAAKYKRYARSSIRTKNLHVLSLYIGILTTRPHHCWRQESNLSLRHPKIRCSLENRHALYH
jgi:hypothetical protein